VSILLLISPIKLTFSKNWHNWFLIFIVPAIIQVKAQALPFNSNSTDFETFINNVWISGGSAGVNIGPSMRSDDRIRESRNYWGFHNCIWKTNSNTLNAETDIQESIGGYAYEIYQCNGYLDYETPMKKERCKGRFSYEWRKKDGVWGKYIEQKLKRLLLIGPCID
jgi:hypothetical protein